MQALGWVIWAFGCLVLIRGVMRLRKPRGRIVRGFFCLVTAAALALTFFTPMSKFHLLWILPLPLLLGLLGFGLLAGGSLTYHKLTARKPEKKTLPAGSFAPFGELTWTKYDWWEGEVRLPAWAGFQSRRGPYGSQDSESPSDGTVEVNVQPGKGDAPLEPSKEQCRAIEFQIEHGEEVVEAVLTALLPHYRQMKEDWEADGEPDDELMPPVAESAEFRKMIGLNIVHVLPYASEGLGYLGFEFGCDWEDEHGLGVVVHGKRVVDIGQASDAFDWRPD
jgi:hypothetical protein